MIPNFAVRNRKSTSAYKLAFETGFRTFRFRIFGGGLPIGALIRRGETINVAHEPSGRRGATREGRRIMLNNIGLPGLLLIAIVVLVLFGRGKISSLMGEVGKGITAFKRGVDDSKKELEDTAESARDVTPDTEKAKGKDKA